ncbi:MAG TPA: carboxypeptidase regulatory-like domain-containing protein [Pyrinomonadaceae bacterium]|nr:carboxypeptidase regulatory-like domain-containing protein [Pyrinomonadaceae bacterium]
MLRVKLSNVLAGAAVLLCLASVEARACLCSTETQPCTLYWNSPVVFTGVATEVGPPVPVEGQPGIVTSRGRRTRFDVEEAFRGVAGDTVETYEQGTSCDYQFSVGERYLVYGARDAADGRIYVVSCSGTKELARAGRDLEFARGVAAGRATPSIVGSVTRETRASITVFAKRQPLDDVEVVVEGGGREARARTDADGNFSLVGLRPGTYKVRARTPSHLRFLYTEPVQPVAVAAGRCAIVHFNVTSLATVGGRVVDHTGAPVETKISLVPLDEEGRPAEPVEGVIENHTDDDGRYEFGWVVPGRYLLAVNSRGQPASYDPPFPRAYLPGVRDTARATVINVVEGMDYEAVEFRLPPPLVAREIEGVVTNPDGTPVPRAQLLLEFTERDGGEMTNSADEQGRFKLKVYEGFTYLLVAEARGQNAQGDWEGRHSEEVEVTIGATNEPVRLVIDREGFHTPRYVKRKREKQN